jgi:hypothetical protein
VAQRVRWPDDLNPQLRKWLTRVQRVQAHLRSTLLIYSNRRNVGGDSLIGNHAYTERAASYDRTILHDALLLARDEFDEVVREVQAVMDSPKPTAAIPGTKEKVDVMEARARGGYSIFIDKDPQH